MAAVKDNLADNPMGIKVGLLETQQKNYCLENVHKTVNLLISLGFTIPQEKSVLEWTQCIEVLAFIMNFADMTIKTNPKKSQIIMEKLRTC